MSGQERLSENERTLSLTVGAWGGFYFHGNRTCWRLCLGFVAITYLHGEWSDAIRALLAEKAKT